MSRVISRLMLIYYINVEIQDKDDAGMKEKIRKYTENLFWESLVLSC